MRNDRMPGGRTAPQLLCIGNDATIMGDYSLPTERAASVTVPTIVIAGGASFPFMSVTAQALADILPHAQTRTLDGQEHNVAPEAMVSRTERVTRSHVPRHPFAATTLLIRPTPRAWPAAAAGPARWAGAC